MERPRVKRIIARLDRLEGEHTSAAAWHREVEEVGTRWLQLGHLTGQETARLNTLLISLSDMYRSHIAVEEQEVFPVAQEELSDSAKQIIGRRMASRRGVPFVSESAHLTTSAVKAIRRHYRRLRGLDQ
jgi:hemerythrin-like domain-containing protein